jgi:opacity protein-like surface antigen
MKNLFLSILLFSYIIGSAQYMDTLRKVFFGSRTFDFRYESKNSFINHDRVEIQSLKFGITFGRKITFGAGYCLLNTALFEKHKHFDEEIKAHVLVDRKFRFNYFCYYFDYIYFKTKRWQYSIPSQFGSGYAKFDYTYGDRKYHEEFLIFLYEPGINIKYKFYNWLGVGATIGYRMALNTNKYLASKFNSPLYSGGVLIYWDQLAVSIFKKNKLVQKWLGPEEW